MKFCPMCKTIQDKSGLTICKFCDYEEKPIEELSKEEFDDLMSPYEYERVEDGVRIISVKNNRSLAFRGAVGIPHFVTEIASNAFADCKFISRIDLPKGLRLIGDGAFAYCRDLFDVFIPTSVTSIGKGAFFECNDLGVINCEKSTQPNTWDKEWLLGCSAKVEWNSVDEM